MSCFSAIHTRDRQQRPHHRNNTVSISSGSAGSLSQIFFRDTGGGASNGPVSSRCNCARPVQYPACVVNVPTAGPTDGALAHRRNHGTEVGVFAENMADVRAYNLTRGDNRLRPCKHNFKRGIRTDFVPFLTEGDTATKSGFQTGSREWGPYRAGGSANGNRTPVWGDAAVHVFRETGRHTHGCRPDLRSVHRTFATMDVHFRDRFPSLFGS